MKHYYTRTLMLLLALTWLVPKANAQYQFTSNNGYFSFDNGTWDHFTYSGLGQSAMWFQGAVANGKIFTLPATMASTTFDTGETGESLSYLINLTDNSGTTHRITRGLYFDFEKHGAEYFSCGNYSGYPVGSGSYWYAGPAIASDDAETLWFPTLRSSKAPSTEYDGSPWNGGIKAVAYYKKESLPGPGVAGSRVGIDLSSYNIGRSDLMSAYGDGANGEGYLWFCDYTNNKIVRVKIVNGQAEGVTRFTPPVKINNARGRTLQYSDDRVIFSNGRDGDRKIYRGVINGSSITWYDLGVTTVGNSTQYKYGCPGATMFIMGGYEYLAYSSATNEFSINVYDASNPATTTTLDVSSNINAFSGSGSTWVNHNIQAVVAADKKSAVLYVYTPQKGAFKRNLKALKTLAQDPVQNFKGELTMVPFEAKDEDQPSRQDAVLTWDAPANGTVAKYTVYRRENPWYSMESNGAANPAPKGPQYTYSAWAEIGTTTELTYTDKCLFWYSINTPRTYQYKIVPTFTSGAIGAESNIVLIEPELVPFVPIWDTTMDQDDKKLGIDRYDGYCKVQLYWTFPQVNNYNYWPSGQKSVYGVKPDYYSIKRNGKTIVDKTVSYVYIDTDVKSEHEYTYEVVSHYFNNEMTAVSKPNTVYVEKRDWAKVGYELTEIYNYKIASSGSNVHIPARSYANIPTSPGSYFQGAYHNGYWYIAQLSDGAGGGGIIKISAANPKDNANENILTPGTKIKSYNSNLSRGIACDDEGNIFVQSSTFGRRLTSGTIYINNGNGNYGSGLTVNLSGIDLHKYDEYDATKFLNNQPGRVDLYSMKGNLKTDGYAYLYLAPSISRGVFVVKLNYNGSSVTAVPHFDAQDTEGRRRWNNEPFIHASENYAIPVKCEGRENEFLHLIRSSALSLWACHDDDNQKKGRITNVYDTQARVNVAGGCTFEFNGELFLVTPSSQYSENPGNFYIGMAERKTIEKDGEKFTPTAAEANFSHIIPVTIIEQPDIVDGEVNQAGSVSIFAVVGNEDINGDGINNNDYVDIYVHAPYGNRFAKYRLTPSNAFPPSQVVLDIKPKYAETYDAGINNPGGDILRFDATATWSQVTDYGTTGNGNNYYQVQSYTLQLVDEAENPISEKDENGNLLFPAIEFDVDANNVPTTVYTVTFDANDVKIKTPVSKESEFYKNLTYTPVERVDKNGEFVTDVNGNKIIDIVYSYVYKDVKKDFAYTALVTVNYIGIADPNRGTSQKSPTTEYEHSNTYQPKEATGVVLVDVKKDNWGDWDADHQGNPASGTKDPDDAYYDSYRVCLKLTNPDFGTDEEYPRSYYTIGIDKDKNGTIDQEITEFKLFYGEQSTVKTLADESATTPIVDKDGYVAITDGKIPGDYDFEIETGGKPHVFWDMLDYTTGYDDNVNYTDTNNPSTWDYIVTTAYAAGNTRISEEATSPMAANPAQGGITTGVEVISTQAVLNVYPIPATISVTIKCSEEIKDIEIYSESGMLVSSMSGNGEQVMTVNVSNLASGYYFMRVNNLAPVKIIKN